MIEPPSRCRECAGPLVHDQRYCLRCGARRGPLPARIGLTVGEILERGRARPQTGADLSAPPAAPPPHGADTLVPAARSAAVAILLMIAFGCVVGSMTTPGGVESLARALVVAVRPPPPAPTPTTSSSLDTAASSDSRGSGGSGASTAASSSPAAAAAPAAVPQQTVTVGNPSSPTGSTTPTTTTPANLLGLPPIKHVWEIVLSDQGYTQAFASSTGHPYLATRLRRQGKLITGYYGVAQSPLANEIALLSGQGPTPQTIAGCPTFADIAPATVTRFAQVTGTGCLYPSTALTLPDQLHAAGLTWRAYVQGIGEPAAAPTSGETTTTTTTTDPATSTTTATSSSSTALAKSCPHPPLGGPDDHLTATPSSPYATWRNPVIYFRSILAGGQCNSGDVGLSRLSTDLKRASTTPAFSYVSPGPCDDGSDTPCAPGAPAGLSEADRFLKTVVPEIERSPAYKQDGLIAITFDGAPATGPYADPTSCCDQPAFPNLPAPATTTSTTTTPTTTTPATTTPTTPTTPPATTTDPTTTPPATTTTTSTTTTTTTTSTTTTLAPGTNPGGGQVGLLLISRYVTPNSVDAVDTFNHFSLLKSIEDLFGLKPLGYARDSALPVFDAAIFTTPKK